MYYGAFAPAHRLTPRLLPVSSRLQCSRGQRFRAGRSCQDRAPLMLLSVTPTISRTLASVAPATTQWRSFTITRFMALSASLVTVALLFIRPLPVVRSVRNAMKHALSSIRPPPAPSSTANSAKVIREQNPVATGLVYQGQPAKASIAVGNGEAALPDESNVREQSAFRKRLIPAVARDASQMYDKLATKSLQADELTEEISEMGSSKEKHKTLTKEESVLQSYRSLSGDERAQRMRQALDDARESFATQLAASASLHAALDAAGSADNNDEGESETAVADDDGDDDIVPTGSLVSRQKRMQRRRHRAQMAADMWRERRRNAATAGETQSNGSMSWRAAFPHLFRSQNSGGESKGVKWRRISITVPVPVDFLVSAERVNGRAASVGLFVCILRQLLEPGHPLFTEQILQTLQLIVLLPVLLQSSLANVQLDSMLPLSD